MIEALANVLRKIDKSIIPEDIADIIWLAEQFGAPTTNYYEAFVERLVTSQMPQDSTNSSKTKPDRQSNKPPSMLDKSETEGEQSQGKASAYLGNNNQSQEEGNGALPLRLSGLPALPRARELARALRPLKRRIPSRVQTVLNEDATVKQSAESGSLYVVSQPALERWLDLALVIDESHSMIIWRQTIVELQRLFEQLGAFRTIETWYFSAEQNDSDYFIYPSRHALAESSDARLPQELAGVQGQRLILVMSDCIATGWYEGAIAQALSKWAKTNLVGLLQMLPEYLWDQTALHYAVLAQIQSRTPGAVNAQFEVQLPAVWRWRKRQPPGIILPVITLQKDSLSTWANLLAGKSQPSIPGLFLPISHVNAKTDESSSPHFVSDTTEGKQQLLQRFYIFASPIAQKLASYLAAMPYLNLPLMRIVQHEMVPESNLSHLAEVVCSGLLTQITPYSKALSPNDILFQFDKSIRDQLTDVLWGAAADNVMNLVCAKVNAFINNVTGKPIEFWAILADPTLLEQIKLAPENRAFAEITIEMLKRRGGRHAALANAMEQRFIPKSAPQVPTPTREFDAKDLRKGYKETQTEQKLNRKREVDVLIKKAGIDGKNNEEDEQTTAVKADQPKRSNFEQIPILGLSSRRFDLEKILTVLYDTLTRLSSESKRLIFIEGDAGIGKSWLLSHLHEFVQGNLQYCQVLGPYKASSFINQTPYYQFIQFMNDCAGRQLCQVVQGQPFTEQDVLSHAEALELELASRKNGPLVIVFDELERWVDVTNAQKETLNKLYRTVWRMLLRQYAMPCVIICAGRRQPEFTDVLLKGASYSYQLRGLPNDELVNLIELKNSSMNRAFILERANGNPGIAILLNFEMQKRPHGIVNVATQRAILRAVFDKLVDNRLDWQLQEILYNLARFRPDGFFEDDPILPNELTIMKLIISSFVDFDAVKRRYHVTSVLYNLFKPETEVVSATGNLMDITDLSISTSPALRKLRLVLSSLIQDVYSVKINLDDAAIRSTSIDFQSSINIVWHNALQEAIKQNRLEALIKIIGEEYPDNHLLLDAYAEFLEKQNPTPKLLDDQLEKKISKRSELYFVQTFWPLVASTRTATQRDANFDFPISEDDFLNLGEAPSYTFITQNGIILESDAKMLSAEDICNTYLLKHTHHIISGRRYAGKTWLRLYLERYVLITNVAPPPIFFFASASLLANMTEIALVRSLAGSFAHRVFLRLLAQGEANQEDLDRLRPDVESIGAFLQHYGYSITERDASLIVPKPTQSVLDLDNANRENSIFQQMKGWIDEADTLVPAQSVAHILNHIQNAMETLGYQQLIVLVDNWDNVAEQPRNRLLSQLLSNSLLTELKQRNIFLKVFVPTFESETKKYFSENYEFDRNQGSNRYRLSLHAHL